MNNIKLSENNYKDRFLWRIGYPLAAISFLFFANDNAFLSLLNIPSFYSDALFALIITFCVGFYLKASTQYLDKKYPWYENFATRLAWQALLGVAIPLVFSMLLEIIYLYFIDIPLESAAIFHLELPLSLLFLLLANAFYLVNYLFYQKKTEIITITETIAAATPPQLDFLTVQKGFSTLQIPLSACAVLMSSHKTLWLHTFQGETFRLQGTLEEWENKLKAVHFYRLNRQYLATRSAIASVEHTETRKLKVHFVLSIEDEVFVAKSNVAAFKAWWKNTCPS